MIPAPAAVRGKLGQISIVSSLGTLSIAPRTPPPNRSRRGHCCSRAPCDSLDRAAARRPRAAAYGDPVPGPAGDRPSGGLRNRACAECGGVGPRRLPAAHRSRLSGTDRAPAGRWGSPPTGTNALEPGSALLSLRRGTAPRSARHAPWRPPPSRGRRPRPRAPQGRSSAHRRRTTTATATPAPAASRDPAATRGAWRAASPRLSRCGEAPQLLRHSSPAGWASSLQVPPRI